MSRANQIKRKWQHQKRVSREKKCQAERVPRTDAVNGRDGQAVRFRSCRLSLYRLRPHSKLPSLGLAALYWTIYRGFPIAIFHYQRVHVERQRVLIQHNTVWSQSNSISINSKYNHPFQAVSGFTFWHPWWDLLSISSNPLRGWNRLRFTADTGYPRNRVAPHTPSTRNWVDKELKWVIPPKKGGYHLPIGNPYIPRDV